MQNIKAFVARSFAPQDEEKIRPILDFLESFSKLGFQCETAEPAEVLSVSAKVQRMIDDSHVFIGIFTKRHPVCRIDEGIRGILKRALSRRPQLWTAPPWVLQESWLCTQGR